MKRNFLFNKKGVSPLIATVLLIAFAVSIGAVIMNWGKSALEEEEEVAEEPDFMKWYMGNNIEDLCYDDTKIIFNVKGDPPINIRATKIIGKGVKEDYLPENIVNIPEEGQVQKITLPFDVSKYGVLNQIIFYSFDTAITKDNPQRCS